MIVYRSVCNAVCLGSMCMCMYVYVHVCMSQINQKKLTINVDDYDAYEQRYDFKW